MWRNAGEHARHAGPLCRASHVPRAAKCLVSVGLLTMTAACSEEPDESAVAAIATATTTATATVTVTSTATVEPSESVDAETSETVRSTPNASESAGSTDGQETISPAGTWSGLVDQSNAFPYTVRLTLELSPNGYEGAVEYLELECGGSLTETNRSGEAYEFQESIEYGSRCVPETRISIVVQKDGNLGYSFDYTGGVTGTALLTPDEGGIVTADRASGVSADEAGGWPTDSSDAAAGLMIWFGAAARVGESSVGFPDWVACDGMDLCIAGGSTLVGVIERKSSGFEEVATIPLSSPPQLSLQKLGYGEDQISSLLDGK